ncbi:MAG TPA: monovalent cation/H+ antiporter subunit D [Kofleriaceae bacterium]|nr:monovalent cation/H+ antiporter subunit D [Kofleriaceae bacterium]
MNGSLSQLLIVPVVLPLVTAAVLVMLGEQRRRLKSIINVVATSMGVVVAATILRYVDGDGPGVHLASNWEAPFGIVLVADRLSALMLVVTGIVSLCAALYAEAGWARVGVHFHPLFQIQLMGLNGAFLTGDLFNLFVFFEVMLAASYGLHLHGSGLPRVGSGLHYLAVNLLASSLFLVGLAVLYGVLGTLNMADIAVKVAHVPANDRGLLLAGAAILALAFLIKAAMWPLNAWLVPAYGAASAPVAGLFAVMTKVGVYTVLRLWALVFSEAAGPSAHFGHSVLLYGGLATIAVGALGLMTTVRLDRIAGFAIIVSSGTLLAAIGQWTPSVTAAALFYLLTATLGVSALFLLVELIERIGTTRQHQLLDLDAPGEDTNLDDDQMPLVGRVFPISIALLALSFMTCTVLVAGLPPLSGFIAKFSLLRSVLSDLGSSAGGWMMMGLLLLSGFAATVSLARAGIRSLWSTGHRAAPEVKAAEAIAVLGLLCSCILLTIFAEPVTRYARATAAELHEPRAYIEKVMSTKSRPRSPSPVPAPETSP